MKIGLIGNGAIAGYARKMLEARGHTIGAILLRRNIRRKFDRKIRRHIRCKIRYTIRHKIRKCWPFLVNC